MIGAGAAGLAAARTLADRGRDVRVLEAGPKPGGVLQTARRDDFLYERGPNTFRLTAPALAFLREAGVEAALVKARSDGGKRFVLRGGELVSVPMGPLALASSPLLSPGGKLQLLREPFAPRGDGARESVADFIDRRFGSELRERMIGPFLVGVYAGDEHQLGAESVFPSLVDYERQAGSVLWGAFRDRLRGGSERGAPGSWSASGGMDGLVQALTRPLGDRVTLNAPVRALARDDEGWRVQTDSASFRARHVVLGVPAPAAAPLLEDISAEAAAVAAGVEYAPMVAVPLAVDPMAATQAIEGFGFLVPREEGLRLLGGLFMSRLFPGRAPGGRELVVAMIGGKRWPEAVDATDDEVLAEVAAGLERALGLRGGMTPLEVIRWPAAVPQPAVGHVARIASARAALQHTGLELAGSWLDGVSVSDTLVSGQRAALRLLSTQAARAAG